MAKAQPAVEAERIRPKKVNQLHKVIMTRKVCEKLEKTLKADPAVLDYLRNSSDNDIWIRKVQPEDRLNEDVIIKWAYANLPEEDYNSLFISQFSSAALYQLAKDGKLDLNELPADAKFTPPETEQIWTK
jgi:hypothetical protein